MRSVAFIGIGGQGIVFAAELLADIFFEHGFYVAQLQSYGAEVRGGSVLAYVVVDDRPIENPFLDRFNIAIVLHEGGLKRWSNYAKRSEIVVVDRDLVKFRDEKTIVVPIVERSIERGIHGVENVVAVGIALSLTLDETLDYGKLRDVIMKKRGAEKNMKAIELGLKLGREIVKPNLQRMQQGQRT